MNESIDVTYTQINEWNAGFQGSIDITNNGDTSIDGWNLDFDLPREINNIWNANIVSSNGDFSIENADYNAEIRPGQTINIGFIGEGSGVIPENFDFDSEVDVFDVETPDVETPEANIPDAETPEVDVPDVETPEADISNVETPEVNIPEADVSDIGGAGENNVFPSTSSLSLRENNQGRGTFTTTDGVFGNSGFDPLTGSASVGIAAINIGQWEGSEASGAFIQVSGPETRAGADPIVVQVYDLLPDRADGLDLSPEAFDQIADPVDGIVDIDYELISPGDDFRTPFGFTIGQGIVAEGIEGTNPFFAAVRFNNHRHPIESVELIGDDGNRTDFTRGSDNRFVLDGGFPINGAQDLEVTDIFGQEVILSDVNITGGADTSQITGEQFGIL